MNLDEKLINDMSDYFKGLGLTFADVAIEILFSIIDPEAPDTKEVASKFAENRKINLKNNDMKYFYKNWKELYEKFYSFLSNMKDNEKEFLSEANIIAEIMTKKSFEDNKAAGLSEIIIGTLDLIVFIYSRYFELKPMIAEMFKYEGDDKEDEFIKILEHTFLQFAHDCKEVNENETYEKFYERVKILFTQSLILCSIALMSRKTREGIQ